MHYNTEEQRRPLFHKLIQSEVLPGGYVTDNGVSIHFIGTDLYKTVSDTPGKYACKVTLDEKGQASEEVIEPELLLE